MVAEYTADRCITVVPEIEMPGHAQAAIAAYPELGNTNVLPPEPLEVSPDWGVNVHVFNANEGTILFLQACSTGAGALPQPVHPRGRR